MRPDLEKYLWENINGPWNEEVAKDDWEQKTPRKVISHMVKSGMIQNAKQAYATLAKWTKKGLYEWGTSIASGWKTSDGPAPLSYAPYQTRMLARMEANRVAQIEDYILTQTKGKIPFNYDLFGNFFAVRINMHITKIMTNGGPMPAIENVARDALDELGLTRLEVIWQSSSDSSKMRGLRLKE